MKFKQLCELFNEPHTKDGKQMAMHKLGNRLRERKWTLCGRELVYHGFTISRNQVAFSLLQGIDIGRCSCQSYFITVEEAIDCISGNLDSLLRYNPTDTVAETSQRVRP